MIHALIVPAAIRDTCNQAAHELGIDPEGTLETLCVPLVPADGSDDAEPTHWGACGQMSEQARLWLAANLGIFAGAMWWRINLDNRLEASSEQGDLGKYWSWQTCLNEVGLKVRAAPMILP